MLTSLKSAVLSLAIGLGTLTGAPAVASAEGIYFGLGIEDGGYGADDYAVQIQDGYSMRRQGRRYHNEGRRCTPERAAYKARRLGLHRVRVVDVGRRTITVRGRAHGDRVQLTFGRSPSCPVLGGF